MAQDSMFKGESRNMKGRLVGRTKSGEVHTLKEFPANGQADHIGIGEILHAADVELDHVLKGEAGPKSETVTTVLLTTRASEARARTLHKKADPNGRVT